MKTESSQNLLSQELSPYLLQHQDNPIHWRPWGEAAFAEAKAQNKPVFLSVGYSTCHWCHVMAHESFEDQEVADAVNRDFIAIKVDREEHPDVDNVYMSVLQSMSGGGGWPMSVWMTPAGLPFFAGTYFPKFRFLQLLRRISQVWTDQPDEVQADGERLMEIVRQGQATTADSADREQYRAFFDTYINHFHHLFDEENGGFGHAPKFPQTMNLMVMMRQDRRTGLHQAEGIVTTTLLKMLRGGIYDHLNGGFHRYSVDEKWLVPHFEKMLYDQATISVTLAEAYSLYGEPELARALRETIDYVLLEMRDKTGGFFSAQDADSHNPNDQHLEEGYFCTYTVQDLVTAGFTQDEINGLKLAYGFSESGQFEGRNILHLQEGVTGEIKRDPHVHSALQKLAIIRKSRPQPHLDDKMITAWNGWMIWALVRAGVVLNEPRYLKAAEESLTFVYNTVWNQPQSKGSLNRFYRSGASTGSGTCEDYASIIYACLEVTQVSDDPQWREWAIELQGVLDQKFLDPSDGVYFLEDGQSRLLPMRPKEQYDGVTPCSNSMAAHNLWRLYLLTGDGSYRDRAERLMSVLFGRLKDAPSSLPFFALALDMRLNDTKVIVTTEEQWTKDLKFKTLKKFSPYGIWISSKSGWPVGKDKVANSSKGIFICREGSCLPPQNTLEEAVAAIES